jgi:hypothetical protein
MVAIFVAVGADLLRVFVRQMIGLSNELTVAAQERDDSPRERVGGKVATRSRRPV